MECWDEEGLAETEAADAVAGSAAFCLTRLSSRCNRCLRSSLSRSSAASPRRDLMHSSQARNSLNQTQKRGAAEVSVPSRSCDPTL